jgi:hypothetical protein
MKPGGLNMVLKDIIPMNRTTLNAVYPSKDGACGHLDCAMDAAKTEAFRPVAMFCFFSIMMMAAGWYEKRDLFTGFQDAEGFIIVFGPIMLLMSIFPFRRWLELREYKNHGTIHGRTARRL